MIANFEWNISQIAYGHQMSGCLDIHSNLQKRDKAYLAGKKVISDHLCSFDDLKYHFRMLYSFIFFIINIYSKKEEKIKKSLQHIGKKCKNVWMSGHPDIRCPRRKYEIPGV